MSTLGIEGVYHVYMKWSPTADVVSDTAIGRTHLTFRNRQNADEFYRFLTTSTDTTGKNPLFSLLVRNGPQFWYFDVTPYAGVNWELPRYILQWNPQWGAKVLLTLMNDWNGRVQDIIPTQATTEWVNGGAYFIKSTNLQTEFWHSNGGLITISNTDRTKFVVRAVAFTSDDRQVLIRTDKITIELAADASTANPIYVTLPSGTSRLGFSSEPYQWTFNDFFASLGIERHTNSNNVWERVVDHSPGTSVVWDLV
ncbi:hypothetical protein EG329_009582 [Mollisiaceae sp. DMI_Dod_QoI]|nr:hypothetical protein EG329_009582 [Helotiales sp. DMI_Dod_QoI]